MRTHSLWAVFCCSLLTAALAGAQVDPQFIYLSNGHRIVQFETSSSTLTPILVEEGVTFEGLNFGPDEHLYFCAPLNGTAGRIDLSDLSGIPFSLSSSPQVEIFYNSTVAGPGEPECGWFTDTQGFIVTDQGNSSGAWLFAGLAGIDFGTAGLPVPTNIVTGPAVGNASLAAPTQYINGTLLLPEPGAGGKGKKAKATGSVRTAQYPDFLDGSGAQDFIQNIDAKGVAVSTGYIFVIDGKSVGRYDSLGTRKEVCTSFNKDKPQAVAADRNGSVFIATESNQGAKLFKTDFDGTGCTGTTQLAQVKKPDPKSFGGIALTPTSVSPTPASLSAGKLLFTFNGTHTWELIAGAACGVGDAIIEAQQVSPSGNADRAGAILPPVPDAAVINFLGDNGFSTRWAVSGLQEQVDNCANELDCDCPPDDTGVYRHLISGYFQQQNARIGVCDTDSLSGCEVIDLTVNLPLNAELETDDPLGGKRRRGSDHFLLDLATATDPEEPGFCGFEPPLTNTLDPNDPLAQVSSGSTLAVKFRLADLDNGGDCQNGPFITNADALLSVARLNPLEVMVVRSSGAGLEDPALFDKPQNPTSQYHYNLNTAGFQPGIYVAAVAFLTNNAGVQQTLFEVTQ